MPRETGMVIDNTGYVWITIPGSATSVDFPEAFIWKLLKEYKDKTFILAHTHPVGFNILSQDDMQMLKAWSFAAPGRIYFDMLVKFSDENHRFIHKRFSIKFETLEEWQARGKEGEREMQIVKEWMDLEDTPWVKKIIELSYIEGGAYGVYMD